MYRKIFLSCIAVALIQTGYSQQFRKELENLCIAGELPAYRSDAIEQLSSYDRIGGNDDGFSGKYSYLRMENNEYVIADLKGPGLINRIWTPTPSNDTIRFYFDGEKIPRINMPFIDLFSGKIYPFQFPLCGNEVGGYFCYAPVSYSKSLKIVYKGSGLKFHQIQFRTLSPDKKIESFSIDLYKKNQNILDRITSVWKREVKAFEIGQEDKILSENINFVLKPGQTGKLFSMNRGGRIVGLELNLGDGLVSRYRDIWFTANWDKTANNAIDMPLADFFGYAFGNQSMHSMLLGTNGSTHYSYLPMPFDNSADLKFEYKQRLDTAQKDIVVSGTIYYTLQKRNPAGEGKFYTQWRREIRPEKGKPYCIANIKGRGHYIGTILIAQGLEEGMTLYWEGDDCSVADDKMIMHGTGSEDYFNGGWYAVMDRWDRGVSMPVHGALIYDLKTAKTGGYRFMLSDKINFDNDYTLTIEHGPENNELDVDYSSVAFFYGDDMTFENTTYSKEIASPSYPHRHILMAQELTTRLYWFTSISFNDGMEFYSRREDSWMTNIDFDAVPMARFELEGLDKGKYKCHVVCKKQKGGNDFCFWQRTKPVSNWIVQDEDASEQETIYLGIIEITEQINTITLRKRKLDNTKVKLYNFIFERI